MPPRAALGGGTMKLSWLWILAAVACLVAAAEDDDDERRDAGGKYVVYRKTDYKGTVSYHIIKASKFRQSPSLHRNTISF